VQLEHAHDIDLGALPDGQWSHVAHPPHRDRSVCYRMGPRAVLINASGAWVVIDATTTLAAGESRHGSLGALRAGLRALGRLTRGARALSDTNEKR
jgi:hypothetical protein